MEILQYTLEQVGLSKNQSKVYLSLLSLGLSTASTIARKSGINRVTCYDTLKQLKSKSIITEIKKNNTTYFQAYPPEILIEKQDKIINDLKSKLPLFKDLLENSPIKPKIQYIDSTEAMKEYYMDMLSDRGIIRSFLGSKITNKKINSFIDDVFDKKRVSKGVTQKVIFSQGKQSKSTYIEQFERKREKLLIKNKIFDMQCGIHIYSSDKVMFTFFTDKNKSITIIQNQFIHNTLKSLFDYTRQTTIDNL